MIGGLVLVGWATNSIALTSLRPSNSVTRPYTAITLTIAGTALWLLTGPQSQKIRNFGNVGGLLVTALGIVMLLDQSVGFGHAIDNLLFPNTQLILPAPRFPLSAGLCFVLCGLALLTLHNETRRGGLPAQSLALTVIALSLLTLLSYAYGIIALYRLETGMALPTALAFVFLSFGVLGAHPNRGLMAVATSKTAGGFMLRRLLLAVIAVPSILGWLNVAATDAKFYSREFGVALLVATNVALFIVVIWRNAQLLHFIDADRQAATDALRKSHEELESRVRSRTAELTTSNETLRTEVAERRRVAEDLRRHREELADFFENATIGLHWVGPDGKILRANRAELEMLGYSRDEYVGHYISEFHTDRAAIEDILQRLARHEEIVDWPAKLRAKDGSIRHVLLNSNVLWENNKFIHTRCFTRDITDAKQIEDERNQLLVREQAARSEAEHSTQMIRRLQRVTDSALSHLSIDDLLREMLVRIQEVLGADAAAILLATEDRKYLAGRIAIGLEEEARVRIPMGRGVAGQIALSRQPLVVDDLSQTEVVSSMLSENARSLVGAPLMVENRVIGVIHVDTVEAHRFTQEDVSLLQLVADRVAPAIEHARLYEAERQSRIDAETANRMKDEFLATISHELRSPLNSILGWISLLREGNLGAQATRNALETVERSARTQNRIISDLLDVSRIINGQLRLNIRRVEPTAVVEAGVEAIRPAANAKGIQLKVELAPNSGAIAGDADRLQQIVWNLVSNAIKFTSKGGTVNVTLERAGHQLVLTVSDTGLGIAPEFLPFVFDRFSQGDGSSTRRQGGLGLGLAIVRHLVEMHGGTVHAESEGVGKGSVFVVRLPRITTMTSPLQLESTVLDGRRDRLNSNFSFPLDGLRVLVVDAEATTRELVSDILAECDADVRSVSSASEALAILTTNSWSPDVLISNLEMPDNDGSQLIRHVRELPPESGGRVPAVALTDNARGEDRLRALAAGFQTHVPKPVEPAELLTVLGSVTGRLAKSTGPLSPL